MADDGQIVNTVGHVKFDNIIQFSELEQSAFHLSSFLTVKPDGRSVVCALGTAGALSFAKIDDDNNMKEVGRNIYYSPKIKPSGDRKLPTIMYSSENKRAFCGIQSDNEYVYLLYSGKTQNERTPAYQCNHLLIYDWNAKPVRHCYLDKSINSFYMEDGILYGVSSYPASQIYIFNMTEKHDSE